MKLNGLVDVLIPRGGAGLIQRCVRESLVPVIETGTGNCHIYVHESADFDKALNIIVNAKTQRVGVCNAAESLLVDRAVADGETPVVKKYVAMYDPADIVRRTWRDAKRKRAVCKYGFVARFQTGLA